jgi:hypothetical protein
MKLLGNISVGFNLTDQLPIRFSAFVRYWRKNWEYNETVHQLFIDFKKAYDSVSLEKEDTLLPLLFNIALEYAIIKEQENQVGLKLNGTHHLLAYTDDVNLLGDNIDTIKRNMETLTDPGKEIGLGINIEKTEYMLVSGRTRPWGLLSL